MELLLERKYLKAAYTIGCLSVDGTRFCDTLEDRLTVLIREAAERGEQTFITITQPIRS